MSRAPSSWRAASLNRSQIALAAINRAEYPLAYAVRASNCFGSVAAHGARPHCSGCGAAYLDRVLPAVLAGQLAVALPPSVKVASTPSNIGLAYDPSFIRGHRYRHSSTSRMVDSRNLSALYGALPA